MKDAANYFCTTQTQECYSVLANIVE